MAKKTTKKQPVKQASAGRKANGQFAAGVSGNPQGRTPGKKYFSEAARDWLGSPNGDDPQVTNAEAAVAVCGAAALKGDISALRELVDRAEGKARQSVDAHVTSEQLTDERRREMAADQLQTVMEKLGLDRDAAIVWLKENVPAAAPWIEKGATHG